jgi:hypothetical protein
MKAQKVSIGKIKLNPSNPRIIKDDKFQKLVKSIQDFPEMKEVRPIVVNEDMVILGGNMRFRAMQEAGVKEVPVVVVDWNEEKQKEFTIKDNLSFGEWDWDALANDWNIEALRDWGVDVPSFNIDLIEPEIDTTRLGENMDKYINNSIKQIVLYYDTEKFEQMLNDLDKIANEKGFEDNSEVVQYLVEQFKKNV